MELVIDVRHGLIRMEQAKAMSGLFIEAKKQTVNTIRFSLRLCASAV